MKKALLIIVSLSMLLLLAAGCSSLYGTSQTVELVNAKTAIVLTDNDSGREIVFFETKDTKSNNTYLFVDFSPSDKLKKTAGELKPGQKMHISFISYSNNNVFVGKYNNPYYHSIEQIILIPSGEKYIF